MKHGAKAKVKRCSSDGCANQALQGGVCIIKHGAKAKRCGSDGGTNHAKRGGVCIKHGVTAQLKDELSS